MTRLRVPAIGVDTALESLRLGADGELVPPHDFGRAGWYAGGTAPGDVGPAVIAGHVDSRSGPAVFFKLREVGTGDTIEVTRGRTPSVHGGVDGLVPEVVLPDRARSTVRPRPPAAADHVRRRLRPLAAVVQGQPGGVRGARVIGVPP